MCIETLIKIAHTNILFGTVLDYEKKNLILIINVKTDNGFLMNSLGTKVRSGGCFWMLTVKNFWPLSVYKLPRRM